MSWTRLDDGWTDSTDFADLDHATRWHYLAMIQFCSRTQKYDGLMRRGDALRCSDVDDPGGALAALAAEGLIAIEDKHVRVLRIDEHVPPPSVRESAEKTKVRVRRHRKHSNGDHSECLPANCDQAPTPSDVTGDVTRYSGTGRAGTGSSCSDASEVDLPVSPDSPSDEQGSRRQSRDGHVTNGGEERRGEERRGEASFDKEVPSGEEAGADVSWSVAEIPAEDPGPRTSPTGEPWPEPLVREEKPEVPRYCRVGGCANRPLPGMSECVDHVPGRSDFEERRARQLAELEKLNTGGEAS